MTDLLDKAVSTARTLPAHAQDEIARMVLALVGSDPAVYQFTPEEEAELAEAKLHGAGRFRRDEEVDAIWAKYGA